MSLGPRLTVFVAALAMVAGTLVLLFVLLKANSPEPRTALEASFQRVMQDARISDRFESGVGWDSEDVTEKVCPRVTVAALQALGMKQEPSWPMTFNGEPSRATYSWRMMQDKPWQDICRTHSNRFLEINIDAETMVCSAKVSVLPQCDP